jgi:protein-tyrosine phosphatase
VIVKVSVLFVCLGNICRSPTADGIFSHRVKEAGLGGRIHVDSAGTADWHTGRAPDARSVTAARERGYDLSRLQARQVIPADFSAFDYVLAMDNHNLAYLRSIAPGDYSGHLGLFLDFAAHQSIREMPDPYYGGNEGFEQVLDLVEAASHGLLEQIQQRFQGA